MLLLNNRAALPLSQSLALFPKSAGTSIVRNRAKNETGRPLPHRHQQGNTINAEQERKGRTVCKAQLLSDLAVTFPVPDLLPLSGPWGVWTALVCAGAVGLWSERTKLGRDLSGALVTTLLGMIMANVGIMPAHAPELRFVFKFLLPLAIPMLLFGANVRVIIRDSGRMLLVFLLGSLMTAVGSLVAVKVLPLQDWLGPEAWKIAAALTARHIGGAVNYISVAESLKVDPALFGAGLAADDLILGFYFLTIYAIAKGLPADEEPQPADGGVVADHGAHGGVGQRSIQVLPALSALALSSIIAYSGFKLSESLSGDLAISLSTALTVLLATALPRLLGPLQNSAEGMACILMQVFYAAIGASAEVALVVRNAPMLLVFCSAALAAHLAGTLAVGRLLGFSTKELLLASNANVGGPATVAGMAASKGWRRSLTPAVLTSTLGYTIGTAVGIALGPVFRTM